MFRLGGSINCCYIVNCRAVLNFKNICFHANIITPPPQANEMGLKIGRSVVDIINHYCGWTTLLPRNI